ncbi:DUF397 domain-containing protein [Micromonospora sp. NPDC048898]|uniref:DUF397 domain-containing protein n=1 Tax=Micromonospora sp. NPDC048898 TaxID=3364260 RepID=UPI0037165424
MTPLNDNRDLGWFKSSRSANNAACVEVRFSTDGVDVRDTKDRSGPMLAFEGSAWSGFLAVLKAGSDPRP